MHGKVAIKQLSERMSDQSKASFQNDVSKMCHISSQHSDFVVRVHGLVDVPPYQPAMLVMEHMFESLSSACSSSPAPSLEQRVEWLVQAGKGISVFHIQTPPIPHCNIKPSNMLISPPTTGRSPYSLHPFQLTLCDTSLQSSSIPQATPHFRTSMLSAWSLGRSFASKCLTSFMKGTCKQSKVMCTCRRARRISRQFPPCAQGHHLRRLASDTQPAPVHRPLRASAGAIFAAFKGQKALPPSALSPILSSFRFCR